MLMFEEFVIDGEAYERITNPGHRYWLGEWPTLVRALESEGAITLAEVQNVARRLPHARAWMLRRDLKNPDRWWPAMAYHDSLLARAIELLGENPREANRIAWRFDPEAGFHMLGEDGKEHNLSVVLSEAGKSDLPAHQNLYGSAVNHLRRQLREVNSCMVVCDKLGAAPLMWAPYRRYLELKLSDSTDNTEEYSRASRKFFEIAFPGYTPLGVRDFLRMRRDRRIRRLREEILSAARSGALDDPRYPQHVLNEVLRIERRGVKTRRIIGWIASGIGAIPIPGAGIAASAAGELLSGLVDWHRKRDWNWFYLISDGRGAT